MSEPTIIEFSRTPLWKRYIAIHEAGHAVAAWLNGAIEIEISLADEFRIAKLSDGKTSEDCLAVCAHNTPNAKHDLLIGMIISFAGVMAEHLYTGVEPVELLEKSGKSDARDILKSLDLHRKSGASENECECLYSRAYSLSLSLVRRYWWEIIALAKLTEHFNYVPSSKIRMLLTMFPSTSQRIDIMKELVS